MKGKRIKRGARAERQVFLLLVADVDGEVATSDNLGVAAGLPESVQRIH